MSLSRTDLTEYYITDKYWDFGGGLIYDKYWNIVGKIHNKLFTLNKRFEIREINNKLLATLEKRLITPHKVQVIKDGSGSQIGVVMRKKLPFRPVIFHFKCDKRQHPYIAKGINFQYSFEIVDNSGRTIARVRKLKLTRGNEINSIGKQGEYFVLKLAIDSIERIHMIAMVIAIENLLHNTFLLSDVAGYGRLIMRLRPFGPGIKEKQLK
jgi:uncharacterized protein YxjI